MNTADLPHHLITGFTLWLYMRRIGDQRGLSSFVVLPRVDPAAEGHGLWLPSISGGKGRAGPDHWPASAAEQVAPGHRIATLLRKPGVGSRVTQSLRQ